MNAGMFGDDLAPVGLYVEDGKRRVRADTRAGPSNFHLLPNGVFWIGDGVAGVGETSRFLADAPAARYATQSGPMLVIDGSIQPKILPTGTSEKIRNGVCVRDGTRRELRDLGATRHVLRLRDDVPRRARLRQRSFPRRLGVLALCARTRPRR